MTTPALLRLVPDASSAAASLLAAGRGVLEPSLRSEIFGPERFAQHGRSLGQTHAASFAASGSKVFFPRLRDNIAMLRQTQAYIGLQASAGHDVSAAAEWLLDNFHLIEAQSREIAEGLPRRFFRDLPVLQDEPLVGLPRIYGVAWAFVAHTDSAFDESLLVHFLKAYQESRELTLGELWALPTTLRVVLIENLRRLAERTAASKAARETANAVCDRIEAYPAERLDRLLAQLEARGVADAFLSQMAQRLYDYHADEETGPRTWLQRSAPQLAEIQTRLPAAQAADNLSVGNAITSLRLIGDADWPDIVESTSVLTQLMLTSRDFADERDDTRDQTLHAIEATARRSGRSESDLARLLLGLMQGGDTAATELGAEAAKDRPTTAASHWLRGPGRPQWLGAIGSRAAEPALRLGLLRPLVLPVYLGALALATVAVVAWVMLRHTTGLAPVGGAFWLMAIAALLVVFPASEMVVAVINRLISESARPSRLPRLAFKAGITPEHRPMVVIPAILSQPSSGVELAHRLELHYLANAERGVQFALLTDWVDADGARGPDDAAWLETAVQAIDRLNLAYPVETAQAPRFVVLHRERTFSSSEKRWIGWERKRGKLEQLLKMLAEGSASPFVDLGRVSQVAPGVRYVLTLDSDTHLPPGRLRDLVGIAAHPHNRPQLSADGRRVERGYAILQPRVATPLPRPGDVTLYHWLFAGQCGIDPYSAASSEVYQDLFGEGTFTGKGLLDVQAVHAVLGGRLPEGRILSHDLLEGSIARCATVTDATVIESAPFHADVAASRVHRWTRGDWQLLPILLRPRRYAIRPVNRWKMLDNLRRSLVAPASLALVVIALASGVVSPVAALVLIGLAFSAGPLMGAFAALVPNRLDIAWRHFYREGLADLARSVLSGTWLLAQLLQMAGMNADAIVRALYRSFISRRHLLEWTTAAAAQAAATTSLAGLIRRHWLTPLAAAAVFAGLVLARTPYPVLAAVVCLAWALSPVWTWWVSRPQPPPNADALAAGDRGYLEGVARDTWRLFERCVVAAEHHLPPDNLQVVPHDMVAHRTSPTNIGLYLLSVACARAYGWIGGVEMAERLEATLATMARLQRHRGHFLNWYDTASTQALLPLYVSTVDSGNLCVHLLAVAQACKSLAEAGPEADAALRHGLAQAKDRLQALQGVDGPADAVNPPGPALTTLLDLADPFATLAADPQRFAALLDAAEAEAVTSPESGTPSQSLEPQATASSGGDDAATARAEAIAWARHDMVATLRSAWRDAVSMQTAAPAPAAPTAPASPSAPAAPMATGLPGDAERLFVRRLEGIAATCQQLAAEADFEFLFHPKRRLFHIGFRLAEFQLDTGFYDLLASEARSTSLWAIAKGDVPAAHWAALGRPFYGAGNLAGLRSWSGSMFEYLMPTLVVDEPQGSVLHSAGCAALNEQMAFAHARHVPWGISESAYAGSDQSLAYQYAPQGVPRLALRRTPADQLVVAPYASALATQLAPHRAASNLRRLQRLRGRGHYGFIEALDYTPSRRSSDTDPARVQTFMAHHQGMSIVAIANVLLERAPRHWGMADPRIEAVSSLLHERTPRAVPPLRDPPAALNLKDAQRRSPGMLREVSPGMAAVEPTQLLTNGRYAVALRGNGAGLSRRGPAAISRWRDDGLRDAYGSFMYLRWDRQPRAVSLTQHPAPDRAAHYQSTFFADRVSLRASWPEIEAETTVWVSPEDDIEFRRVELRNVGERSLDLELMSAFEVSLADARADESHPAFQNLFVTAEWRDDQQALVFERKPRLATEKGLVAAHFIAEAVEAQRSIRLQVDRRRWLGRNRDASDPLAAFDAVPASPDAAPLALDTGLDPVAALSIRLQIPPGSKARLVFCTAAADDHETLRAVIDKYRQANNVQRASMMSATLAGIGLRDLRNSSETLGAIQTVTTLLALTPTRLHMREGDPAEACDRSLLWRFGISGDRPIVLVAAGVAEGFGLLRALAWALHLWARGGVACDLVVVNHEPASYLMALQRQIVGLKEAHAAVCAAEPCVAETGFHALPATDLTADEAATLRTLARVRFNADGRPLAHHVQELADAHDAALEARQAVSTTPLPVDRGGESEPRLSTGDFAAGGGEFRFDVGAGRRPARPWVNVLANADFGAQLSEAGGGYSWGLNSRLNMLTPWSNDPVADPPGEWFLLQDMRSREVWSVTPSAAGHDQAEYRVAHGQGFSSIGHRHGALEVSASWCVDAASAVKQVRLRLVNRGHRSLHLRVIGVAEWILGGARVDRGSTHAFMHSHRAADSSATAEAPAADAGSTSMTTLYCTQREHSAGFGGGTAFFGLTGAADELADWTCDRREVFDARGRFVVPDQYAESSGCGLDPCAAIATQLRLRGGETADRVFLLGWAADPAAARQLAAAAALVPPLQRLQAVRAHWDELLGSATVRTPDPLFDALVNRWLLYQTVACRLWARAGFYQAGGAFGFRDQLQDAMALAWAAPELLKKQILLAASRQFVEGDVQHWWHTPTGAGVRTHFSDDLLWLPYAAMRYADATLDAALFDETVAFISGPPIPPGAEDAYFAPEISDESATLYEHCARAIDKSLAVGRHGLPLMGSGDWNDGMNRVGHEGQGESVWLAWFLCDIAARFAVVAQRRGDAGRAQRWRSAASGLHRALEAEGWDGDWYRRAFFDDGSPLGSSSNRECRIDLIAQAWSVLSQAAPPERADRAMAALAEHLVDGDAHLLRLLDPPLQHAEPSAGYIQAYPPGVRENGGQYSHAAVWALMAEAARGNGDTALRYFTYLSPAHRSRLPVHGEAYAIEPYVMAGDVYSAPPYVGRGGWSWYTGSAGWLHRAAIESMFGMRQHGDEIEFVPCLPSAWPDCELLLKHAGKRLRVVFVGGSGPSPEHRASMPSARLLRAGERLRWSSLAEDAVVMLVEGNAEGASLPALSYSSNGAVPMRSIWGNA